MLTQAKLAEFHNTSDRSVRRWSAEEKHRKTIQAEADVTPLEWQLVGEISQLCYLYNAQNWHCNSATAWAHLSVSSYAVTVALYKDLTSSHERLFCAEVSNTAELTLIKMQLEKLVY